MKEKYYEELYKRWYWWVQYSKNIADMDKYTKFTTDLCTWLSVLDAASAEEWAADKAAYNYIFSVNDDFKAFICNFMKEKE